MDLTLPLIRLSKFSVVLRIFFKTSLWLKLLILLCITRVMFSGVISMFLLLIVLQTNSPTECIDNPMFCVDSPTKHILAVFSPTNHRSYSTVGLSIRWWRPFYRKCYFLYDNRHTSRVQCIISPNSFRTFDTLVETNAS